MSYLLAAECTRLGVRISQKSCVNGIYDYLGAIVRFVEGAIGVAIIIAIVIAGIQYITSSGNPDSIKVAKSRLSQAIIGLVLYILMVAILEWLGLGEAIS